MNDFVLFWPSVGTSLFRLMGTYDSSNILVMKKEKEEEENPWQHQSSVRNVPAAHYNLPIWA